MSLLLAGGCSIPARVAFLPDPAPIAKQASAIEGTSSGVTHEGAPADTNESGATSAAAEPEPPMLDAWELSAQDDGAACRETLKTSGYKFQALPDRKQRDKSGCGMPHGVVVIKGPTGILYDPPITVDCTLARALGTVERIVQEEAETHLHSRITKIANLGGYACRPRNFRKGASLSAHAVGSAVDLASFHPAKGQPAVIDRDYDENPRSTAAQDDRRRFLRAVYTRLRRREADLTYVVGPDFNATHHNHFHLDRGGWAFWFNR